MQAEGAKNTSGSIYLKTVVAATDHYSVLGLHPGASDADIRRTYRHLSLELHPDKCSAVDAEAAFKKLSPERVAIFMFGHGDSDGVEESFQDVQGVEIDMPCHDDMPRRAAMA